MINIFKAGPYFIALNKISAVSEVRSGDFTIYIDGSSPLTVNGPDGLVAHVHTELLKHWDAYLNG